MRRRITSGVVPHWEPRRSGRGKSHFTNQQGKDGARSKEGRGRSGRRGAGGGGREGGGRAARGWAAGGGVGGACAAARAAGGAAGACPGPEAIATVGGPHHRRPQASPASTAGTA